MMNAMKHKNPPSMKLVIGICTLAFSLGAAMLWNSTRHGDLHSMGMFAGVGVGAVAVAGLGALWFRNRRRSELRGMRDSALW
jgi:hypothetical protein